MAGILASLAGDVSSASAMETNLVSADASHIEPTSSEIPSTRESIDDPEMAAAFADDAQQCLAEMEASLLAIESGQSASEALRNIPAAVTYPEKERLALSGCINWRRSYIHSKVTSKKQPKTESTLINC